MVRPRWRRHAAQVRRVVNRHGEKNEQHDQADRRDCNHPAVRISRTKERDRKLEAIARVPAFARLPPHDLLALGRMFELAALDEGSALVVEGGLARLCMVVVDGRALATRRGEPAGVLGPGDWQGTRPEADYLGDITVRALEPMTILVADRRAARGLLSAHPGLQARAAATARLAAGTSALEPGSHSVRRTSPVYGHDVGEAASVPRRGDHW